VRRGIHKIMLWQLYLIQALLLKKLTQNAKVFKVVGVKTYYKTKFLLLFLFIRITRSRQL